jgi:hypothetical protein
VNKILREYIKTIVESSSRISLGDIAQKRIAAWFIDQGMTASVNKPGSASTDIEVKSPTGEDASVESKNSTSGKNIYAHELTPGSEIAKAIKFKPGKFFEGLSLDRFNPAKNGKPILGKSANSIRESQNKVIQNALSKDGEFFQVLFGGISTAKESLGLGKGLQFIRTLKTDGSIIIKADNEFRPTIIVITPGLSGDKTRLRFWAEGSSKLRAASGGKGQQTLGTYEMIDDSALTEAWKKDYFNDDYFVIVTGDSMYIGYVNKNPLGLNVNQLSVKLNMPPGGRTMTYGGTNISGIREKVMIEIIGAMEVKIPDLTTADIYEQQGLISIR